MRKGAFETRGFTVLHDVLPKEVVCDVCGSFRRALLNDDESMRQGVTRTSEWHVVRHLRQAGRVDWEVLDATPVLDTLDAVSAAVGDDLQRILDTDSMVLNTCGVVTSFPGCGPQIIHRDGPPSEGHRL